MVAFLCCTVLLYICIKLYCLVSCQNSSYYGKNVTEKKINYIYNIAQSVALTHHTSMYVCLPLLSSSWVWSGDDFAMCCVRSFVGLAGLDLSRCCCAPRRDGVPDVDPLAAVDWGRCGETERRTSVLLPCRLSAPLPPPPPLWPAGDADFLNGLLPPALPGLCCCCTCHTMTWLHTALGQRSRYPASLITMVTCSVYCLRPRVGRGVGVRDLWSQPSMHGVLHDVQSTYAICFRTS